MFTVVSEDLKILSIKKFKTPSFFERWSINKTIKQSLSDHLQMIRQFIVDGFNFPLRTNKYFDSLYGDFVDISFEIFGDLNVSDRNDRTCWCYRSNKCRPAGGSVFFHHHEHTATINAVYYLDIPKGNSISFMENDNNLTYYPEQYEILIFPGTLLHKPDVPVSKKIRQSINLELLVDASSYHVFKNLNEIR